MTHLWRLDFEDCAKMTELDPSIGHLKSLTDLTLRNCKSLKELPQEVSQLTSLIMLDVTGCHQITALPQSMRCLKQLERLYIRMCSSLTEIPECICSFLNLEILDASYRQLIAFLPNWIGKLKILSYLDLRSTAIEELPHSIVSLEKLEELSVSHCYRLKFLPRFPPSLTGVKARVCTELGKIEDVSSLKELYSLDLRGCGKLVDIPGIEKMKLLHELDLVGCRSLHDSFLERLLEANFQDLGLFSIPGRRLIDGGSSYPQSLSFLLPKQFETGILYLHVDKSSLDNIFSELDESKGCEWEDESIRSEEDRNMDREDESIRSGEDRSMDSEDESLKSEEDRNMDSNDSELAYKSVPSDDVTESQPGRVVRIEITTDDDKFHFPALIKIGWHKTSEGDGLRKLPTATFGCDSELMKMTKGDFEGKMVTPSGGR